MRTCTYLFRGVGMGVQVREDVRGIGSPGSGVTVSCELPGMSTENQTQVLGNSSQVFLPAGPPLQLFAFALFFMLLGWFVVWFWFWFLLVCLLW